MYEQVSKSGGRWWDDGFVLGVDDNEKKLLCNQMINALFVIKLITRLNDTFNYNVIAPLAICSSITIELWIIMQQLVGTVPLYVLLSNIQQR